MGSKEIGGNLKVDICMRGVKAKFEQNEVLMSMLRTTSPKILVEATSDRL